MAETSSRIDAVWIALNAFRGLVKIASRGDMAKSTYDNALDIGGALYPDLLGAENSILRRERESDTTKEYRQRAELSSLRDKEKVEPLTLVQNDLDEYSGLLEIAKKEKDNKGRVDQIKRRLNRLIIAEKELNPVSHSENQLIFRDVYNIDIEAPCMFTGQGHRDFKLPDEKVLRVRVLHPDKPEHISGADIVYEKHDHSGNGASIIAVQYKIWSEDRVLYLSESRMNDQLKKLHDFLCANGVCDHDSGDNTYRFPFCSAFLRPTDKLQKSDQKFVSSGEHLPICRIDECKSAGVRGADLLEYRNMKEVSLSSDMFEILFNKGKIGSGLLSYDMIYELYSEKLSIQDKGNVIIYAQEFI